MDIAEELRYLILALQREGNRELTDALRPLNLTPAQAEVLRVLAQFEELTLIELGERLVCETGSPSRLVKTMVSLGYVIKTPDELDRRAVRLSLTPHGKSLVHHLDQVEDVYHQNIADMISKLPIPAETILQILREMVADTPAGRAVELRKLKHTHG